MKKTLLEIMRDRREKKQAEEEIDCPVFNPLNLSFSSLIELSFPSKYQGKQLRVVKIAEMERLVDNHGSLKLADYHLTDPASPVISVLRVIPRNDGDFDAVISQKCDAMAYDEDFHIVMKETHETKKFLINDGAEVFFRINDLSSPWNIESCSVEDSNKDRKMNRSDAVVEEEFEPMLNWESESFGWFELTDLPSPLHFGLEALLND